MSYRDPGESRILESDVTTNSNAMSRHSIRAIVLGGLIAGFCDLTYAMTYYAMHGVAAIRIPQSIASGVLGSASFKGGWKTAAFGVLLHFFTAFCAAGFYYAASRKLRLLLRWAPIAGMLYGAAIFFFMRRVVIPLSAVPHPKSPPHFIWTDFMVHVFLIGLPIALLARHYGAQPLTQPMAHARRSVASRDS